MVVSVLREKWCRRTVFSVGDNGASLDGTIDTS